MRWVCLEDILDGLARWNHTAQVPFIVKATTLSDDDSRTFRSFYRLYAPGIDVFLQEDFLKCVEAAIAKNTSFNSTYLNIPILVTPQAYAGALMLDSHTSRIGFFRDKNGNPTIPFTRAFTNSLYPRG